MTVWFTSDTHFGHRGMVENGWRPAFTSVDEMNEILIANWNRQVRKDDTVWHLGDFGLGNVRDLYPIIGKLSGIKHLITGNHDKCWPGNRDSHKFQKPFIDAGFESVQAFARRKIMGQRVRLSHFPYRDSGDHTDVERFPEYRLEDLGEFLIHGHVHDLWKFRNREINVGVDVWGFELVPLDAIEQYMKEQDN